jgi:hypothetical protein
LRPRQALELLDVSRKLGHAGVCVLLFTLLRHFDFWRRFRGDRALAEGQLVWGWRSGLLAILDIGLDLATRRSRRALAGSLRHSGGQALTVRAEISALRLNNLSGLGRGHRARLFCIRDSKHNAGLEPVHVVPQEGVAVSPIE